MAFPGDSLGQLQLSPADQAGCVLWQSIAEVIQQVYDTRQQTVFGCHTNFIGVQLLLLQLVQCTLTVT